MHEDGELHLKVNLYPCSSAFKALTTWKVELPKLLIGFQLLTKKNFCTSRASETAVIIQVKTLPNKGKKKC